VSIDPFSLIETTPGAFSLLLRDLDATASTFEAAGHTGNGYSWQVVAQHLLETNLTDIADRIEFDPEADMFCAYGTDQRALAQLGERLSDFVRHPKQLAKVIATIPPSAWDD
jgi:hypothetical protein